MDLIKAALISLFMCPADSGQPVSEGSLKDLHSALLLTSGATHMHHLIAGDEVCVTLSLSYNNIFFFNQRVVWLKGMQSMAQILLNIMHPLVCDILRYYSAAP